MSLIGICSLRTTYSEAAMRLLPFMFGIICVGIIGIGTPAEAQNYPWCANYDGLGGGFNCGFTTFQQCLNTVSGIGGFCQLNTQHLYGQHQMAGEEFVRSPKFVSKLGQKGATGLYAIALT